MKHQRMTYAFIAIIFLICVVYDVFVLVDGGTESSISYVLMTWAYKYPILPFGVGFLCGHLFWRIKNVKGTDKLGK